MPTIDAVPSRADFMERQTRALAPLRIAFLSVSDVAGGAEAHTVALGRGLSARGHDISLYGRCPGWDEGGLPRHSLRLGPKWSRRTLAAGVMRVPVERRRVRAVPRASLYYLQFKREQIALTSTISRKAPVVWAEHGRFMGGASGRLLLAAYGRAARHVSKVICVSDGVANDLRQVVDPDKLVVVPNAVDTERFAPPPPQRRSDLRQRLLPGRLRERTIGVLAARLHPDKRHERAIAAAKASGSVLLVLGDGPARTGLETFTAGHEDVCFLGHRDDVPDFLALSDYYVYCGSPTEGLPTSILEAASCGLPIVGFAGDPCLDLIDRCGGMVLADPAELTADRMAALLAQRGTGVAHVARHYSRDGWLDAHEHIFRECAE